MKMKLSDIVQCKSHRKWKCTFHGVTSNDCKNECLKEAKAKLEDSETIRKAQLEKIKELKQEIEDLKYDLLEMDIHETT